METIGKISYKDYQCSDCGHIKKIDTNHWGQCYSLGHYNTCPNCPPYKKYPEFGGSTTWNCLEEPPEGFKRPENWKKTTIKIKKVKK